MELSQQGKLYNETLYDEIGESKMNDDTIDMSNISEERLREIIAEELERFGIGGTAELSGSVFDPQNVDAAAIRQLRLTADTMNAMAVSHYEQDYANAMLEWRHGRESDIRTPAYAWIVEIDNGHPKTYKLVESEEFVTEAKVAPWNLPRPTPVTISEGYISIGDPINGMGWMYGFFDNGSNVPMGYQVTYKGIRVWFKPDSGISAAVWVPVKE